MNQTFSVNYASTMFDVCERLAPPQAVSAHTLPDIWYYVNVSLALTKTSYLSRA